MSFRAPYLYFPVGVPLKVTKMSCDFLKNLQIILMTHLGTPTWNNRYGQKTVNFWLLFLPIRHFIDFLHFSLPSKTALTYFLKYWILEECPLRAVVLVVGSFHQAEFSPKSAHVWILSWPPNPLNVPLTTLMGTLCVVWKYYGLIHITGWTL